MEFTTIANARKQTGLSYLGNRNISAKLVKNRKVSNVITYCMYLAPANTSGYNVCEGSTKECRLGCLSTSGHRGIEIACGTNIIGACRINKTKLFHEDNKFFMAWLVAELNSHLNYATKIGLPFSVRLNGTSDIDWTKEYHNGWTIFEIFPETQFYDYTKIFDRFYNKPTNYHLTYSYTGRNVEKCVGLLDLAYNVAVIFDIKKGHALPKTWKGFEVIDADLTDARFLDPKGTVTGLKWKRIANRQIETEIRNSLFVVKPNDLDCQF